MTKKTSSGKRKIRRPARGAAASRRPSSSASRRKSASIRRAAAVKRRVRPAARAKARQTKISQRPMPRPPGRRKPVARPSAARPSPARAASTREPSQDLQLAIDQLHRQFGSLEADSQLGGVYDAIGNIDAKLTALPFTLEALRDRGYVHSGQLEDRLEAIDDRWDDVRPQVEKSLQDHVNRLDSELDQAERRMNRLSASNIKSAETAVNSLNRRVGAARTAVMGLFDGMESDLDQIDYSLSKVAAMLDLLDGSPEIQLQEAEGPLIVVKTEWHQDGDEGPKGYLFLTDQRLLFEQREEVVTRKRFGIFKADSEMVQKLLLDIPVDEIESVSHKEEGGFLGMGKEDILEMVFSAAAPISRARFHLKGQDSSDWAAMLKRVQSDDIDNDRADEYLDEMEAAEGIAAAFPELCPNCFAPVPPQPRGITSYTCEFCGTVITPQAPAE